MIGQTLSHFKITAKLGEGGMGEVYRAEDTKLGREVAIKVLPAAFVEDDERLARFEREAKALAALNHPNIAAIYGFEEAAPQVDDPAGAELATARFLVMEIVEGEDLADRLKRGAIPQDEALRIALEITHALEAAHRKGIVHRDLKPANIKLGESGTVKVLDFGLAKALEPQADPGDADLTQSPTLTDQATMAGVLLGTAGYMSPEQARGEPVDARTDIWAFGVVLWEMLTGRRLFTGKTASDTLAGVLRQEIDLEELPPSTPRALRRLLGRCLERDADSRLRDIADARLEIEEAIANPEPEVRTEPGGLSRLWPAAALAGILVGVGLGALLWRGETAARSSEALTILKTMARPVGLGSVNTQPEVALSRDGRHLVYTSRDGSLMHRQLDRLDEVAIPGTEGGRYPEFSPDGTALAFFRDGRLWRIPLAGGRAAQLREQNSAYVGGLDWATDGYIYTTIYRSLVRVPEGGGPGELLELPEDAAEPGRWVAGDAASLRDDWKVEEESVLYPSVLPDGETLLYTAFTKETGEFEFGAGEIWTLSLADGTRQKLATGYGQLVPTESSHLLACSPDGTVSAIPFDPQTNQLAGPPAPVLRGVMPYSNFYPGCHMAFSSRGTVAYVPLKLEARDNRLAWLDPQGRVEPLAEFVGQFGFPRLSPDGKRLAYSELRFDDSLPTENIWTIDLERQVRTQLTDLRRARVPVWSRDGETLFFSQPQPTGGWSNGGVFSVPAVGGVEHDRESRGIFQWISDMSPDSRFLLIATDLEGGHEDLVFFPRGKPEEMKYLLESRENRTVARFSPDGRWVAFMQRQGDRWEIFVTAFPESSGTTRISRDGGVGPVWSPDGQAIFYQSGATVYRVPIDASDRFEAGAPEVFAEVTSLSENTRFLISDLAGDGRFVGVIRDTRVTDRQQIDIAFDFFAELERLAPHP